ARAGHGLDHEHPVHLALHASHRPDRGLRRRRDRAPAPRRARLHVPGGGERDRQALRRALPPAALRPRGLRAHRAPDRRADRPRGDRRGRGDLSDVPRLPAGGARARLALLPDHADVAVARPAGPDPAADQVARRVLPADPPRRLRPGGRRRRGPRPTPVRGGARADPGEGGRAARAPAGRLRTL
ncbi:MAG: hypothetical protein AVDCRST_MAG79-2740, partial [uncultured Thermoleophilia bacterium]